MYKKYSLNGRNRYTEKHMFTIQDNYVETNKPREEKVKKKMRSMRN